VGFLLKSVLFLISSVHNFCYVTGYSHVNTGVSLSKELQMCLITVNKFSSLLVEVMCLIFHCVST